MQDTCRMLEEDHQLTPLHVVLKRQSCWHTSFSSERITSIHLFSLIYCELEKQSCN